MMNKVLSLNRQTALRECCPEPGVFEAPDSRPEGIESANKRHEGSAKLKVGRHIFGHG
jgi:hypothetical protein